MNSLFLLIKGAFMGIAEVIPGVSGGTIAFITGIYEKLLSSIKSILTPKIWLSLFKGQFKVFWLNINGSFLMTLLLGMVGGLVFGILVITYLLETFPVLIWSFFFGLIVASSIYVASKVKNWNWGRILILMTGGIIAYGITVLNPGEGSSSLVFVFISGMIAISALILPGISGSFILLLMGMYPIILGTAKSLLTNFNPDDLLLLFTFSLGCLAGLALFSRVLTFAFSKFPNNTLALLTGFMIGSLSKIWPWRTVLEYRINSKGEQVPFRENPVLPTDFPGEPMILGALIAFVGGILLVYIFSYIEKNYRKS
jgi:putative membrane protein